MLTLNMKKYVCQMVTTVPLTFEFFIRLRVGLLERSNNFVVVVMSGGGGEVFEISAKY